MNWKHYFIDSTSKKLTFSDREYELTDDNHIINQQQFLLDIYKEYRFDFTGQDITFTISRHHNVTDIKPSTQRAVHISQNGDVVWENKEDWYQRTGIFSGYVLDYEFGYIAGLTHPLGDLRGMQSASMVDGYQMWQRATSFVPTIPFRQK